MHQTRGPQVLIVADDFTSAADGAAPFAGQGRTSIVSFGAPHAPAEVTGIDLDSRNLLAEDAAGLTEQIFAGNLPPVVIKTVDSTLRGNLNAEIRAAWRASGRSHAILAPAFPAEGRTTRCGVQLVNGVPVAESSFGNDRVHPVGTSDLSNLFPDARLLPAGEIPSLPEEGGMIIADAAEDRDLDHLVASVRQPESVLWIGSPGLCSALARRYPGTPGPRPVLASERVLVIVGSEHQASREQLRRLRLSSVHVDLAEADGHEAAKLVDFAFTRAHLVTVTDSSLRATAAQTRARFALLASQLRESPHIDAIIATGGDTARAVLEALGSPELEILTEPFPGAVVARTLDERSRVFVVKAGGFGGPNLLVELNGIVRGMTEVEESEK